MSNWPPSEADPLLAEIHAHPADDEPRLVYADWLEERGDPQAELIRCQCGPGEASPEAARHEAELVAMQRTAWLSRLKSIGVEDVVIRRGFVEKVQLQGTGVLIQPWLLFRAAPALRGLMWRGIPQRTAPDSLQKLFKLQFLDTLTGLDLSQNRLEGPSLETITQQARLPHLATLLLAGNRLGGHGVKVLCDSPLLRSVTTLNLSQNELSAQGFRGLATSPYVGRLESLCLDGNSGGDAGIAALAASAMFKALRTLSAAANEITHDGIRSLANARTLTSLTTLNLASNPIGPVGASLLASSSNFSRLASLNLRSCDLGPEGAQALAQSLHLRSLRTLDLFGNRIGNGAVAFAASKNFASLESLELGANDIDAAGARALAESPHLSRLTALKISLNPLGNARSLRERFGKAVHM